ncbi:MAG: 4Fe-4S cluster-binding domain-containing protein, partial [Candidatus Riflebacteria bacterium]|nr:4Fe-4S cluster-binding domain-containing protein [Candidatus Riflebacteria bacterium]
NNRKEVCRLIRKCRENYPNKSIWLYTGYKWEDVKDIEELKLTDVVAEGPFVEELKDNNLEWVGSSNQRVIDVKKTFDSSKVTLV